MAQLTDQQQKLISGSLLFLSVVGDLLSSMLFDCIVLLRREPTYGQRLKQQAERLERQRRLFEGVYAYSGEDQTVFADVCEAMEKNYQPFFLQIESCVRIALGAMKKLPQQVNREVYTQFVCAYLFADIVGSLRISVDRALEAYGVRVGGYKYDVAKFKPLVTKVIEAYAGKGTREELKRIEDDRATLHACQNLFNELGENAFRAIMQNVLQQRNNIQQ